MSKLTKLELEAVIAELETVTTAHEENPGPYHPQHHAAKRALAKLRAAKERS